MSKTNELAPNAKSFLVVAATFFVYQLYLLFNSFSAVNRIYQRVFHSSSTNPSFWSVFWFSSEFIGEIGLIVRFSGACLLVAFLSVLIFRRRSVLSILRKAVLCEGAYYLFILPFIVYMLVRPYESGSAQLVSAEAALSYTLQMLLISPSFFVLYRKLRSTEVDTLQVRKWGAIGLVVFLLALWIKHFLLNLYALPIDLTDGVLLVGFLNSALTMLFAAILLPVAFLPWIRKKSACYNSALAGLGLTLVGAYFLVYVAVALSNQSYLNFLELTEIWAISIPIAGLGLIRQNDKKVGATAAFPPH